MESLGKELSDLVLTGANRTLDPSPRKRGILDVLDVVCSRGFLRAATRLCVASKAVAAVAPMGTGKQVYEAAKAGHDGQLTTYLEYWRAHADSPEVLNWAPVPVGIKVKGKASRKGQPMHAQFQDSPLVAAVMHDRLACVQLLVASAPFVDVNKGRFAAPLHYASRLGRTAMVCALLAAQGIEVNRRSDTDRTPLHWAAELGHTDVARALLEAKGIEANTPDATGRMPLHWAAEKGYVGVVRLLVAVRGIQLTIEDTDEAGLGLPRRDPLELAAREGHADVVAVLTEAIEKAHVLDEAGYLIYDAADEGDTARLRPLLQRWGGNAEVVNWSDRHAMRGTPILTASREGHLQAVQLLASTPGVDINRPNFQNWSPLMKAAWGGHVDIARFLLSLDGVDLNMRAASGCGEGMTALGLVKERREQYGQGPVVWRGKERIADLLRAAGAKE